MSAMELRNYGYAIQLLQMILKSHPEFLLARQVARRATVAKTAGKEQFFGLSSASFSTMKVQSMVEKDPLGAIDAVEKILESRAYNPQVNQLLKDAALAAKMPELALFALETIVERQSHGHHRRCTSIAKLYMANELPAKAVDVYGKILSIAPNDLTAVKGGKDAAAGASMQKAAGKRKRQPIAISSRNKEQAVALEQAGPRLSQR